MIAKWLRHAALTAILGLGVGASWANADGYPVPQQQQPVVIHNMTAAQPQTPSVGQPPMQGQIIWDQPQEVQPAPAAAGRSHPLRDMVLNTRDAMRGGVQNTGDAVRNTARCTGDATRYVLEMDCWAHPNCLGCGSFQSTMLYMFGSCRTFYGQTCTSGPPDPYYVPTNGRTAQNLTMPIQPIIQSSQSSCPFCNK